MFAVEMLAPFPQALQDFWFDQMYFYLHFTKCVQVIIFVADYYGGKNDVYIFM